MLKRYRLRTLALPLLAGAVALWPQGLDPSEARLSAAAYLPKAADTFRAESRLVEIGVVVRDSRGHSVSGLTQADFDVRDEGNRREIKAFSVQKFIPADAATAGEPGSGAAAAAPGNEPHPRWVAMVFDDLGMPQPDLYHSKTAAKRFLKDGLAANDRVAVLTTSSGQVLPFTADAARIEAAIDKINLQERKVESSTCPTLTPYDAYQIATGVDSSALLVKASEYALCASACGPPPTRRTRPNSPPPPPCDAAIQGVQAISQSLWEQARWNSQNTLISLKSIVDFMTRLNGTRVILMASSGFLSATLEYEESRLVDRALAGNVVINSLDAKGLYSSEGPEIGQPHTPQSMIHEQMQGTRGKAALNDAMGDLAESTGGLYFHNNNDLDRGFKELGMQPDVSYLLAVEPAALDNKYHRLKVNLTGGNHGAVQARKGYLAAAAEPGNPENAPPADRRMDKEVFTTTSLDQAPVTVAVSSGKSAEGHTTAELTFHVNIAKARFNQQADRRAQSFHMIAVLFDADGTYVNGTEAQLEFALKEPTYQRLLPGGFDARISLDVAPGTYRLRTVMVEGGENGRYSTSIGPAEIR